MRTACCAGWGEGKPSCSSVGGVLPELEPWFAPTLRVLSFSKHAEGKFDLWIVICSLTGHRLVHE